MTHLQLDAACLCPLCATIRAAELINTAVTLARPRPDFLFGKKKNPTELIHGTHSLVLFFSKKKYKYRSYTDSFPYNIFLPN
jgi:hypothetical protein